MSPKELQQHAFDQGVLWGRFKEQLEGSEDVEWLRQRVLKLVDYLDQADDIDPVHVDALEVHTVLIESVRDRLLEEE